MHLPPPVPVLSPTGVFPSSSLSFFCPSKMSEATHDTCLRVSPYRHILPFHAMILPFYFFPIFSPLAPCLCFWWSPGGTFMNFSAFFRLFLPSSFVVVDSLSFFFSCLFFSLHNFFPLTKSLTTRGECESLTDFPAPRFPPFAPRRLWFPLNPTLLSLPVNKPAP